MAEQKKEYITLDENGLASVEGYFTVYNYSYSTGEYIGSSDEYLMVGIGIPAYSLPVSPPDISEGYVAVAKADVWSLEPDYRGKTAYAKDGSGSLIVTLPGELGDEYTFELRETPYDDWSDNGWVTNQDKLKAAQIAEAEATKAALLNAATQAIVVWQTKLLRGRQLTELEAASLDLWLDHIDKLEAIDTSLAPDIAWPEAP